MTDVAVVYQFFVPKVKVNILEVPFTHFPISGADNLTQPEADNFDKFRNRLDAAASYAEVWQIVKETVDFAFGKHRGSMMLFLDDMPLQVGAYHPVGTNNIVLNRRLVDIVEAALSSKRLVNALVYKTCSCTSTSTRWVNSQRSK